MLKVYLTFILGLLNVIEPITILLEGGRALDFAVSAAFSSK